MKSDFHLEPHELLPVAVMRCLAIVEYLGRFKSIKSALTLQKAAIFDAALKNPNIARRLISNLMPEKLSGMELPHVLYPSDEEHGLATNKRNITKIATLLSRVELISLEQLDGTLTLKPKNSQALLDINSLPAHWQSTIKVLKALSSKSANILEQAVIRDSKNHAEQHVFIVRKPNTEGGNKELRSHLF